MTNKKEVFIHIGLPKSGSSLLQQYVLPGLEREKKLNFLNVQRIDELIRKIVYQDDYTFDANQVRKEIEEHLMPGPNVISVEWLSGDIGYKVFNRFTTASRLFDIFPDAKIILILRNQVDFAYSAYKQHIHQGGALSLTDYFNWNGHEIYTGFRFPLFKMDDHKFYWPSLLYSGLFHAYDKYLKKGNLHVFLFESFIADKENFVRDLLNLIITGHQESIRSVAIPKINTGYGKRQISIARILNRFVYSQYNPFGLKLIPAGVKKNGNVSAYHIRKLLQSEISFKILGEKPIKVPEISEAIKSMFYDDNIKIMKFFPARDLKVFQYYYL